MSTAAISPVNREPPESCAWQAVSWLGRQWVLNPQNPWGNFCMFPFRLVAGTVASFVAGVFGSIYHFFAVPGCIVLNLAGKREWSHVEDHFASMGADILRFITLGALTGLVFMIKPSAYDKDRSEPPLQFEWLPMWLVVMFCSVFCS